MTFYLGYDSDSTDILTQYDSAEQAAFNSEEWCEVEADTLEQAKEKYEASFLAWKLEQEFKFNKP